LECRLEKSAVGDVLVCDGLGRYLRPDVPRSGVIGRVADLPVQQRVCDLRAGGREKRLVAGRTEINRSHEAVGDS
jgi:hypothetical protein